MIPTATQLLTTTITTTTIFHVEVRVMPVQILDAQMDKFVTELMTLTTLLTLIHLEALQHVMVCALRLQ